MENRKEQSSVIKPGQGLKPLKLAPRAVMLATKADFDLIKEIIPVDGNRFKRLFTSRLFSTDLELTVVCPMVGAPYAVMLLEVLIAWGVREVIFLGWCGAVSPDVQIGDLIVPSGALVDEGTSGHYLPGQACATPSATISARLSDALKEHEADWHEGRIWTTDAVYRETREKIAAFQRRGALAVDMETSALFNVAQFRGVELGALLVVSDELSDFNWKPGFDRPAFKEGRKSACEVVKRVCQR